MLDETSPNYGSSCGMSTFPVAGIISRQPLVSLARRTPIAFAPPPVQDIRTFQALSASVDQLDESSLMPSSYKHTPDCTWYTLCLTLRPSDSGDPRYRYRVHRRELHLSLDTAESSYWLFQQNFEGLIKDANTGTLFSRPWNEEELREQVPKRRCLPRPDEPPIGHCVRRGYEDGGIVDLERWPVEHDVTFAVPAWDWKKNQKSKTTELKFPLILAKAASEVAARQPVDGNMGLNVPGARALWENVDATDRVTIYDILRHADCVEGIEEIDGGDLVFIVRLLIPTGTGHQAVGDSKTRSFLYFGKGTPCVFCTWDLELVSITLLEPLVDWADHEGLDENQWVKRPIRMADETYLDENANCVENKRAGIRVAFDTCSWCSTLPKRVVASIWSDWFEQDPSNLPGIDEAIWHEGPADRFSGSDILFKFVDSGGQDLDLRCSARHFLSSPWSVEAGGIQSYIQTGPGNGHEVTWILGMNFFWSFMVKMETTYTGLRPVPGVHSPTVRFTPQRILCAGVPIAEPWDLPILPDLPPRLQNDLRGSDMPELHPGRSV
ncbi:hypothetical protein OH76DRAFT_844606 [Lentinus brumalis]|uniref:Uncharacterized protein n=1 Tax=Lentinus brumalis TaxID=2498619 RepID=A0A371DQM9_9APHY|nr:hypothetical protein OH76DRAFT_844606 [Polyporus brumalis]